MVVLLLYKLRKLANKNCTVTDNPQVFNLDTLPNYLAQLLSNNFMPIFKNTEK